MRPLRLDIAGFAAFRDPVTVDFTDAEYFALTGPTGSGKSTVIDAMTFALYGSAPRWGRDNAIQYALAPTANRCTVRLVFDVAGQRYVVAREVRRSGKSILQKNQRLERFLDPAATGEPEADEPTESLAADKAVRAQVVELLGLDFDDFCTCVVLPQGDFATFLTATVAERQKILLKLLGARHYEAIGRLANTRATQASARIDALQGQLTGYADATEEAESLARQREVALRDLAVRVNADVTALSAVLDERTRTASRVDQLVDELALLAAVEAPHDIDDLQRSSATADGAYADARRAEHDADELLVDAERCLREGPQRTPLEETLRWHGELALAQARQPALAAADESGAAALAVAELVAEAAELTLSQARAVHDQRRTAVQEATQRLSDIDRRLAAVQDVAVPDGTDDLDRATATARVVADDAATELVLAEAAVTDAAAAVAALPERSAIASIQRSVDAYASAVDQLRALSEHVDEIAAEVTDTERAATEAAGRVDAARKTLEQATVTSSAASLRPHLEIGHNCPVCDQTVAALPPALHEPALDDARASLVDAEDQHRSATTAAHRLNARLSTLASQRDAQIARLDELDRLLQQDLPESAAGADRHPAHDHRAVGALLARLDEAQAGQRTALAAREEARAAGHTAERERARLAEQTQRGWQTLHATRGRLAAFGAPEVTGSGLAGGWGSLVSWCQAQAANASTERATIRLAVEAAVRDLGASEQSLVAATSAAQAAIEERQAAAVVASAARTDWAELQRRLAELTSLLADRPAEPVARELLAEHEQLETAARAARTAAQAAGQARLRAEEERDRWRAARETARTALHRAREPLVALGAPPVDDSSLDAAWAHLVAWAASESAVHRSDLASGQTALQAADARLREGLAAVNDLLIGHELPPSTWSAEELGGSQGSTRMLRIATDVEIAVERARAATAALERRRGEADKLRAMIATDTETEQVARQLAQMMSAKRFPQWLADAALDTLVADASASLLELSGRQFELTHEKGEFFVVDHADADSQRSVKTLSGGETFQASLALALALSEQLSTLAAGGRTTLDSIFLDEGFGTLDPDALEIVASTLENLAQGRRMVGVVTHVAALAERVPVRFEVSRDSRTSTIERVGP